MFTQRARWVSSIIINLSIATAIAACNDTTTEQPRDTGSRSDSGADAASAGKGGAEASDRGSPTTGAGGADAGVPSAPGTGGTGGSGGASGGSGGAAAVDAGSSSSSELSASERASLLFTREEEKLARDVYTKLQGSDPVFENIAAAEQMHMDAVATLLTRYALPDPTEAKADGEFTDASLQALYDRLTEEGSASAVAALEVGVEIEELDIRDITEVTEDVTHADIKRVYEQLTRGSRNHLRAFYSRLGALGGSYTAKYLDPAAFEEIATGAIEKGP